MDILPLPTIGRAALLALALACTAAAPARAQELVEGTRVRVTAHEARQVGTVRAAGGDSLELQLSGGGTATYAWRDIERLEHSHGTRGWAGRGALIGAGLATGLTVAALAFDGSEEDDLEGWGDVIVIMALPMNAALGAAVGAVAGLVWRTERWSVLPVSGRAALRAGPRGVGVTLSF